MRPATHIRITSTIAATGDDRNSVRVDSPDTVSLPDETAACLVSEIPPTDRTVLSDADSALRPILLAVRLTSPTVSRHGTAKRISGLSMTTLTLHRSDSMTRAAITDVSESRFSATTAMVSCRDDLLLLPHDTIINVIDSSMAIEHGFICDIAWSIRQWHQNRGSPWPRNRDDRG